MQHKSGTAYIWRDNMHETTGVRNFLAWLKCGWSG